MEKNNVREPYYMSLPSLIALTGFIAGVGGALLGYFAYSFHFSKINPDLILDIFRGDWKDGWLGLIVATILYGILSIGVAFLYYAILKQKRSIIWGAVFGLILFLLIFFLLYPIFPSLDRITEYDFETITTEVCLFLLYGIFIGYSISYEYNEQKYWKKIDESQ